MPDAVYIGSCSMFLDYFALGVLIFVAIVLFYGIIAIHDIPYEIAKGRNHPQQDALHVAGWVSLFTLHAIWPFLWIWATLYREDRGWGFQTASRVVPPPDDPAEAGLADLKREIQSLSERLSALEHPAEQ
jgi:hypothetical protein